MGIGAKGVRRLRSNDRDERTVVTVFSWHHQQQSCLEKTLGVIKLDKRSINHEIWFWSDDAQIKLDGKNRSYRKFIIFNSTTTRDRTIVGLS